MWNPNGKILIKVQSFSLPEIKTAKITTPTKITSDLKENGTPQISKKKEEAGKLGKIGKR